VSEDGREWAYDKRGPLNVHIDETDDPGAIAAIDAAIKAMDEADQEALDKLEKSIENNQELGSRLEE
jgi:hypothetical protein